MPKALQRLIDMIHYLPWIWEKTAAKLAFFLFQANPSYAKNFSEAILDVHETLVECERCHGMTDKEHPMCAICSDTKRDKNSICVVEDYLDMLSIERTGVYRGHYHVLGGAISPIQWVTPEKLHFDTLFERVLSDTEITEVILATNPNIEWEATTLYATEHMPRDIAITRLSKWLPHAGAIEYADEITLLSAFKGRG